MMTMLTLQRPLADHAKTSLFLLRNSSNFFSSFGSRVTLIVTTLSGRCSSRGTLLTWQSSSKFTFFISYQLLEWWEIFVGFDDMDVSLSRSHAMLDVSGQFGCPALR